MCTVERCAGRMNGRLAASFLFTVAPLSRLITPPNGQRAGLKVRPERRSGGRPQARGRRANKNRLSGPTVNSKGRLGEAIMSVVPL